MYTTTYQHKHRIFKVKTKLDILLLVYRCFVLDAFESMRKFCIMVDWLSQTLHSVRAEK